MFPIIVLFALAIIQLALVFSARHVVNYAAFCAVRSAIVWQRGSGGKGLGDPEHPLCMARKAAAVACLSIAPPPRGAIYRALGAAGGAAAPGGAELLKYLLRMHLVSRSLSGGRVSLPVGNLMGRYLVSTVATRVWFVDGNGRSVERVAPGERITARVVHWYRLRLPVVSRLLGFKVWPVPDGSGQGVRLVGRDPLETEWLLGQVGRRIDSISSMPGYYLPLTASCTMDVE